MRKLSGVPKLAKGQDNALEFTFQYEDGSTEEVVCPAQFVSEFLQAVTAVDAGKDNPDGERSVDLLEVSYEAGMGRVTIGVPADHGTIEMVLGHEKATSLGERLLHAAKKSTDDDTAPQLPPT